LEVGGHLTSLRRTRIGPFGVSDASSDVANAKLIPMAEVVQDLMATIEVTQDQAIDLGHGKRLSGTFSQPTAALFEGSLVAILESSGKILVGFPQEQNA
jgi:tRNA pseudouridine55 synthase